MNIEPESFAKESVTDRLRILTTWHTLVPMVVGVISLFISFLAFFQLYGREQYIADSPKDAAAIFAKTDVAVSMAMAHLDRVLIEIDRPTVEIAKLRSEALLAKENMEQLRTTLAILSERRRTQNQLGPSFNFISFAQAADSDALTPSRATVPPLASDMKRWVLGMVLSVLGVTFLSSIVIIFKTTNAEVLKFAFDTVKTLLGFFIGVATTLIGAA